MELPKQYDPKTSEPKWQKFWDENEIYKFDPNSDKPVYSVDTPPPTVSGKMHIGHAFSYSQMDFIVRYKRMRGYEVFYPFGTDDNGLATERLIERTKNVKSTKMKRKDFVKLCLDTLKEIRPQFVLDWKNLGICCDFSIFYSTINDHCQKISQKSFIDLYKIGREFRKESPTMWCPQCQTAIAQVELKDKELSSHFSDIVFMVGKTKVIIATTRPELLPACVAVFAHPDDERYTKLVGKKAIVPLFGQEVPILADERVDPEKGTGIVMCCTFGDQTDIEWYKAYNLPLKVAITKDGKMNDTAGKFKGLNIRDGRKAIIEELENQGLLVAKKDITHTVNVHERCGTEIEILETKQWFIRYLDIKDELLKRGKELHWFPPHMRARFDNWINGLQWDWCISRQRHFGVPFPVWYCKHCDEVILADEEQLPVDPLADKPKKKCKCGSSEFEPEKDVLDTWATSSLTPQLAIELYKDHAVYKKLYPLDLRPQAHDIITFWLFNTVVKNHFHYNSIPWKHVAVSGFALDPHGKKMSKSLGNVVDPREVMGRHSADALRFWAGSSKLGEDLPFQEKELVTATKTMVKLWNACRFAFMHLEDFKSGKVKLDVFDKGMLSKLNNIVKVSTDHFENYDYSKTKAETEKFFWLMFCDNYLEIVKDRLYNPDRRGKDARKSGQYALYQMMLTVIKLFAPIMPHITEELYQYYFKKLDGHESVHLTAWPEFDKKLVDADAEKLADLVIAAVEHVRRAKSEQNLRLNAPVKLLLVKAKITKKDFDAVTEDIKGATKAEKVSFEKLPAKSSMDWEFVVEL